MYPWQNFMIGLAEHLAWPILVATCIYTFKKDIQKLLSRLTKLPGGAELSLETIERQQEDKNEFDKLLAQRQLSEKKKIFPRKLKRRVNNYELM